ncbi:glycoside hydrolase [Hymenobacter sp. DH14]|uniref:Glycoside hydrolase n=1 Tax=Hymenobacter cyanobacteriorum TaxID=2926463 RepID=A0A9X2AG45_9BACT|nr:sialidase family protein [Hymenobacter cyanobacteriorum]MCI1188841.1 glycoside hydrolase [Hymenobacter cyanobacteriorum]
MLHSSTPAVCVRLLMAVGVLVSAGCAKEKPTPAPPVDKTIKINMVRGNNQRDTVGHVAPDTIVVKVLRGSRPAVGYQVQFDKPSCNVEPSVLSQVYTDAKGQAYYRWRLSGDVGTQTLTVHAIDSLGTEQAKTLAVATAVRPTSGWHPGACLPLGINALCQLPNGRVLAGLNYNAGVTNGFLYYSDNEGLTWQRQPNFPGPDVVSAIKATPQGELFVATGATNAPGALYYSADNGQTWQNRTAGISDPRMFQDISYTASGRLFVSTYFGGLSMSTDNGKTWTAANGLSNSDRFRNVVELANGDLLVVDEGSYLYKSTNGGLNWNRTSNTPLYSVYNLLADANGDLYASVDQCNGNIYKSTDSGASWQKIYTAPPVQSTCLKVTNLSKVGNTLYFMVGGIGIVKTTDFTTYTYFRRRPRGFIFMPTRNHTLLLEDTGELLYHLN